MSAVQFAGQGAAKADIGKTLPHVSSSKLHSWQQGQDPEQDKNHRGLKKITIKLQCAASINKP